MNIYQPSFLSLSPPVSSLTAFAASDFAGPYPLYGSAYGGTGAGGTAARRPVAPGKVTLTSRLPGRPEGAPQGVPLAEGQGADSFSGGALDDPFALHLLGAGGATAAPASAAPAVQLAGPPSLDFGEVPAGEVHREDIHVYNIHISGSAYVSASLEGGREIALGYPVPNVLRPSREDPGMPFPIVYQPQTRGESRATLTVSASWPEYTGWSPASLRIPITGVAYLYGEQPPSAVAAERAREKEQAENVAAEQAREAALDKNVDDDNEIDAPYPEGAKNKLEDAHLRAADALEQFTDLQSVGIDIADNEAGLFRRKVPNTDPSLLSSLAMSALDMATYGLAGMAASWARAEMTKKVTIPPQWTLRRGVPVPPSPDAKPTETTNLPIPLAINISEALKKGLRDAGKGARDAILGASTSKEAPRQTVSDEAREEFFSEQRTALANSKADRAKALRDTLRRLRPLMRGKNPDAASFAMNAVAGALEMTAQMARNLQADETRFAWMRFLAQTELGSLPGATGGEKIPDLRAGLDLPRENEDLPRYDGVLDLEVSADYSNPRDTLKIVAARMNGVTPAMTRSLSLMPLAQVLEKGIVVRVHFKSPGLAVVPVVAVFEKDRIVFEDETSPAGETSHWLSKLGGYVGRPSPERQRLGAKFLRDQLKTQTLDDLGLQVETDHAG